MPDELLQEIVIPPPLRGIRQGLDPTLPDALYSPLYAPDIVNLRVNKGLWETRLGQTLWQTIPGSGNVRLLDVYYNAAGDRYRLVARGNTTAAVFYDYQQGVDTSFQTTAGGTGLGGATYPYFQGVVLNDFYYFTDRQNVLRKYDPTNGVATLTQPTAPVVAPGIKPRPYRILENWSSLGSWTKSNAAKYSLTDVTATVPAPGGGNSVRISILATDARTETITRNVSAETINSHTIAFWQLQNRTRYYTELQIGSVGPTDFTNAIKTVDNNNWRPNFFPVGDIPSINYKRFKCIKSDETIDLYLSPLYLPGKLDGQYRWRYTHYNPTTGQESEPSPVSNGGLPNDFSLGGKTNDANTGSAFNKAAVLTFTSDAGTDASTTKVRFYRNGGVAELTKDSAGRDVWFKTGEVNDVSTTVKTNVAANATAVELTSVTGIAAGDTIVLDKGVVGSEEYVDVVSIAALILTLREPLLYAHTAVTSTAQMAFLDNIANEEVDTLALVQNERDAAPTAVQWLSRSPDGRLWCFGYSGKPTGVRVSNRQTPERPTDYEVWPLGVDPLTRQDPLQGWDFELGGDTTDEAIMWGGHFRGLAMALTRRNLYVIDAASQSDWGPNAIRKELNIGCLAGHTVCEVNGMLYWVADGPRVVRWGGPGTAPEVISHLDVNIALNNAPTAYWNQWIAAAHAKRDGNYYCLFYTPNASTTNIERLDYNSDSGLWEPQRYKTASGAAFAGLGLVTLSGGADVSDLYQAGTDGNIYQAETGLTDAGSAIAISLTTKKFEMGNVSVAHRYLLRMAAVTDTVTLTVTTGGSEYGDVAQTYTLSLSGTGDKEIRQRLYRNQKGRWVQIGIAGSVSNRPAFRDQRLWFHAHRAGHYTR